MNEMNSESMMPYMIGGGVFSLVILACVIVQTVSQGKMLRELRRIGSNSTRNRAPGAGSASLAFSRCTTRPFGYEPPAGWNGVLTRQ